MKITAQAYDMTYSAECNDDANLSKVVARLIVPLLNSLGYSDKLITALFADGDPANWDDAYDDEPYEFQPTVPGKSKARTSGVLGGI